MKTILKSNVFRGSLCGWLIGVSGNMTIVALNSKAPVFGFISICLLILGVVLLMMFGTIEHARRIRREHYEEYRQRREKAGLK